MIYIEKNKNNSIVLRLGKVTTISNPYYLFELISENNRDKYYYFTAPETSSATCFYNKFTIIETGSTYVMSNSIYENGDYLEQNHLIIYPILTGSTFNFEYGDYTCNIYEASASTISVSATTGTPIYTDLFRVGGVDTDQINNIYK